MIIGFLENKQGKKWSNFMWPKCHIIVTLDQITQYIYRSRWGRLFFGLGHNLWSKFSSGTLGFLFCLLVYNEVRENFTHYKPFNEPHVKKQVRVWSTRYYTRKQSELLEFGYFLLFYLFARKKYNRSPQKRLLGKYRTPWPTSAAIIRTPFQIQVLFQKILGNSEIL